MYAGRLASWVLLLVAFRPTLSRAQQPSEPTEATSALPLSGLAYRVERVERSTAGELRVSATVSETGEDLVVCAPWGSFALDSTPTQVCSTLSHEDGFPVHARAFVLGPDHLAVVVDHDLDRVVDPPRGRRSRWTEIVVVHRHIARGDRLPTYRVGELGWTAIRVRNLRFSFRGGCIHWSGTEFHPCVAD